jgi:predicted GIY-YIG superfamily endonuclease
MPTIAPHIWPIPDHFWQRRGVIAIVPTVWYMGPMPVTDGDALRITGGSPYDAYVYIIADDLGTVLYVGKTVNLCGRFSSHRHYKEWWQTSGRLVLLAIGGEDRAEAERAALYIELLAIRDCKPIHNIAGVPVL